MKTLIVEVRDELVSKILESLLIKDLSKSMDVVYLSITVSTKFVLTKILCINVIVIVEGIGSNEVGLMAMIIGSKKSISHLTDN